MKVVDVVVDDNDAVDAARQSDYVVASGEAPDIAHLPDPEFMQSIF